MDQSGLDTWQPLIEVLTGFKDVQVDILVSPQDTLVWLGLRQPKLGVISVLAFL